MTWRRRLPVTTGFVVLVIWALVSDTFTQGGILTNPRRTLRRHHPYRSSRELRRFSFNVSSSPADAQASYVASATWHGGSTVACGRVRLDGDGVRQVATFDLPAWIDTRHIDVRVSRRTDNWTVLDHNTAFRRKVNDEANRKQHKDTWRQRLSTAELRSIRVRDDVVLQDRYDVAELSPPAPPPNMWCDEQFFPPAQHGVMDMRAWGTPHCRGWMPANCRFRTCFGVSRLLSLHDHTPPLPPPPPPPPPSSPPLSSTRAVTAAACVPPDTSIVYMTDSNGELTMNVFRRRFPDGGCTGPGEGRCAHVGLGSNSTFAWRFFRGQSLGDGISGYIMQAGRQHVYGDDAWPRHLDEFDTLDVSTVRRRKSLCEHVFFDDALTSIRRHHIVFLSAGFWPVIYKSFDFAATFAHGVRLAVADCARLQKPVSVIWVESMATDLSTRRDNGTNWRTAWNRRIEEEEGIMQEILAGTVNAVVPLHAITQSSRRYTGHVGDGIHQDAETYAYVARLLLQYAMWSHGRWMEERGES